MKLKYFVSIVSLALPLFVNATPKTTIQTSEKSPVQIGNHNTVNQAGRDIINNTTYVIAPKPTPAKKSKTKSTRVPKPTKSTAAAKPQPKCDIEGDQNVSCNSVGGDMNISFGTKPTN